MKHINLVLLLLISSCYCQSNENSLVQCGDDYVLFDQTHGEVEPECDQGCPEVNSCESCQELCNLDENCQAYECNFSQDKISCSFNGHLTITEDCGPLCQTQNICVKNSTLVDALNFVSPKSHNRRQLYFGGPSTPSCYSGYSDQTNGNAYWWYCGLNCPGGMFWTDQWCQCACQKRNLGQLNMKLAPIIKSIVFKNNKLNVKSELLARIKGQCSHISDYQTINQVPEQIDLDWQCGSKYFEHGGKSYSPSQGIKNDIKRVFGVTENDLDVPFFPNGVQHDQHNRGNAKRGSWCGMPSPEATGFQGPEKYWENCLMEHAGYFNALKCTGENGQVHAVLGIAAMNPDVCYPTHAHLNEEVYWQIGGKGTWKAWTHKDGDHKLQDENRHLDYSNHRQMALQTYEYYGDNMVDYDATTQVNVGLGNGLNTLIRHDHPAGIVHEMSTKPDEHMVMVYWWARNFDVVTNTKYHFAHYVTDSCSLGRIQQVQLSSGPVIPDDSSNFQCKATQKVVTGFDCEISSQHSSGLKEWHGTTYGPNGGIQGGYGSTVGRLFEFQCQTASCRDSDGEMGNYWATCGYSWKNVDDLHDDDYVIVDIKTEASNNPGSCYDGTYIRGFDLDSTGMNAIDSQGDQGHWGFWFCYKQELWKTVKSSGANVITDLTAKTSSHQPDYLYIGEGRCRTPDNQQPMASIYVGYSNADLCKARCDNEAGCIGIQYLGQYNHCWLYGGAFSGRVNLFQGPLNDPITKIYNHEPRAECWARAHRYSYIGEGRCRTLDNQQPMASIYVGIYNADLCKARCDNEDACIGIQYLGQHGHCWLYGGAFSGRVNLFQGPLTDPITKIFNHEPRAECWTRNKAGFTRIGQWDTHWSASAKAYGDNKQTADWLYLFSKREHFSSTGRVGRRKLATSPSSRLLSDPRLN